MCHCLDVLRSGYYEWRGRKPSKLAQENAELSALIRKIFHGGRDAYGSRRIKKALAREGLIVSRRRIRELMKVCELFCKTKRKYRVTTDFKHPLTLSENLLNREFDVNKANQVYVGDITYIETQQGFLYLAIVIKQ